jgi:hypothetical protein
MLFQALAMLEILERSSSWELGTVVFLADKASAF